MFLVHVILFILIFKTLIVLNIISIFGYTYTFRNAKFKYHNIRQRHIDERRIGR